MADAPCGSPAHVRLWPGDRPLSLADEAALLEPVLAATDARFHLIGHSDGGAVALKVALAHPPRLASLVLFGGRPIPRLLDRTGRLGELAGGSPVNDRRRDEDGEGRMACRIRRVDAPPGLRLDRCAHLDRTAAPPT
jgi:pimeloyl-ACP methyl ester carboxylesterase